MAPRLIRLRHGLLTVFLGSLLACGSSVDTPDGGAQDGGTGGTAGSGGAGGAAGAGGTNADANDCGCASDFMAWTMDGGLVFYSDISGLHPCSTFVFQRSTQADPNSPISCQQELGSCAGAISAGDVARAVAHPDVQNAITQGDVLYGEDTRPADGQVLQIEFSNATIEVGVPCRTTACTPIPPGVDALATLLNTLTKQELGRPPCSTKFPPP